LGRNPTDSADFQANGLLAPANAGAETRGLRALALTVERRTRVLIIIIIDAPQKLWLNEQRRL
jgi:hypothetical protein